MERSSPEAVISAQVVAEVSGVLYRRFGVKDTTRHVSGVLSYRVKVQPVTSEVVRAAAEYARDYRVLPYDRIYVAAALALGAREILSADKELDRVSELIRRVDPLDYAPRR